MSSYSEEVKRICSVFFSYRNDIDIYIEDGFGNKDFYRVLVNRLLIDSTIKVQDIFPIGNRENLIEMCLKDNFNHRKKYYIVNGQFDFINSDKKIIHENLYYLNAFDIENTVFEKDSIEKFVRNNSKNKIKEKMALLDFEGWIDYNSKILIDLFLHYSLLHNLNQNIEFGDISKFYKKQKNEYLLDSSRIEVFIKILKNKILSIISEKTYDSTISNKRKEWKAQNNFLLIISAKNYLIPLLQKRLESIGIEESINEFHNIRMFLINNCDLGKLNKLKQTLVNSKIGIY